MKYEDFTKWMDKQVDVAKWQITNEELFEPDISSHANFIINECMYLIKNEACKMITVSNSKVEIFDNALYLIKKLEFLLKGVKSLEWLESAADTFKITIARFSMILDEDGIENG